MLEINRVSVYGLTREKRKKRIEKSWHLSADELNKFPELKDFIYKNIVTLFNMPEYSIEMGLSNAVLYVKGGRRGRLPKAYITEFEERNEKFTLIDSIRRSCDDKIFVLGSERIAEWFREERYWPKTYLFIVQCSIEVGSFSESFIGIMATKLEYGVLAESPDKIMEQLRQGIIGDIIKKGMIYPHIVEENGILKVEPRVKVYESSESKYFYKFLQLKIPTDIQEYTESSYDEFISRGGRTLDQLEEYLGGAFEHGKVNLLVDEMKISIPLPSLKKVKIIMVRKGLYIVTMEGSSVDLKLGERSLIEDRVLNTLSVSEFVKYLEGLKSEGTYSTS